MTPRLDPQSYAEACNLSDECSGSMRRRDALMAELVALRRLHETAWRERRVPLSLIRALSRLPDVGDVAAWERAVEAARRESEMSQPGSPGLLQTSGRST